VETPAVQDNEYDDPTNHVSLSLSLSHTGTHTHCPKGAYS